MTRAVFFTVSDARYFLGTVALVNSLRLCGHHEEIVVLDSGLTDEHRAILRPHATLLPLPPLGPVSNHTYFKLVAPRARTDDLVVLVDSDMVVTAHLGDLIGRADHGVVVAYPDPARHRWFAEWQTLFGLESPPRHDVYLNAGFVILARRHMPALLDQWWNACQRTARDPTVAEGGAGPTAQADQDALNAILMSEYPEGTVWLGPATDAPQAEALRRGVDVVDAGRLSCRYLGFPTRVLHSADQPKPWMSARELRRTAYVLLLRRLLSRSDVAIRLSVQIVPAWLREDWPSKVLLTGLHYRSRAVSLARQLRRRARL